MRVLPLMEYCETSTRLPFRKTRLFEVMVLASEKVFCPSVAENLPTVFVAAFMFAVLVLISDRFALMALVLEEILPVFVLIFPRLELMALVLLLILPVLLLMDELFELMLVVFVPMFPVLVLILERLALMLLVFPEMAVLLEEMSLALELIFPVLVLIFPRLLLMLPVLVLIFERLELMAPELELMPAVLLLMEVPCDATSDCKEVMLVPAHATESFNETSTTLLVEILFVALAAEFRMYSFLCLMSKTCEPTGRFRRNWEVSDATVTVLMFRVWAKSPAVSKKSAAIREIDLFIFLCLADDDYFIELV